MSMFGAENLDPASIHAQQVIVSEIFRSAEGERALTLGHVLKVYDATIAKHGICATDLAGIQIYRALLQWGRHTGNQANARAPLEPILPDAVCWKSNSLPAQAPKAYIPVQAKPTTGPQAPSLVSVPAVLAQTSPTRQRTRKPSPAESRLKEAGGESVLTGETTASPEEPLTAVAATPEVAAIRQGDKDPGPDLVDLLPTASALVSTSMLPFRSPEEASAWQPRPQPDLGDPGMAILADAFAYRKSLARAVGAWQSAVQDERELVLELRRKQALGYWYRRTRSDMAERAADLARRSSQRRQSLKLGVARWQLCLTARRSFRDRFARLHGFQCRRCLHAAYGSWLLVVHSAKELLAHGTRLARCRVLQACWTALRAYSHQRQLMALYRSWADVHWLRSRLTAAWQAWLRWFRKRGKVVAMRSEQQLLAAWCWLRVHAAGSGCHRRWLPRSSGHTQQRTWWWDPAVDLLFDPAPFEIHPHHMQAVQLTVLRGFVTALLKKMFSSWQMQARATSSFLLKVRLRALSTYLSAWQVQAEEVQRSRACQQEVESLRAGRSRARALKTWSRRCRRQIEHRQRAQDFAADCWHRSCRRAFLAWRIAWDWEAAVLKAQSRAGGRLLGAVMKAWVGLWHYERQEVILLRLSGLFLRKSSLRSGLRQLHVHVGIQARRRALLQAEAQLREAQLRKSWRWLEACWGAWRRQAAHSRLMKLYRSWADVHWLRSRLTAAWQAWLQWFRKRGKVVAMRSAPQLLAAWRWLRVHAACSAHVEFTRRPQLPVDAVAAPWQRVAAELLFGSAPFDIHPHHMQAMRCGLELFATALRQKLLAFWKSEVSRSRDRMQRRKSCMSRRWLWAWKAAAERCRRLHSIKTAVLSFRCRRARRRLLHRWSRRTTQRAECRQRAQDLVLACLRRTCRRALDAWLRARRWQALARRVQKHQLRSQFQAWVAQWQDDRQEATLLRLSALCLRKRSLRMGLLALRSQVRREVALRACRKVRDAAAEARRKLLEACWMCFVRYAESRRLMKLYRSWADVHWLRSRLTAAWQAWLQWFRKRGKVVAMRSAPQLLAAWRWLRVHAACSAPGRSVRRLQLPTDTTAAAPWQPVAAELLFGSAPFDVHLHHMQAMQQSLLILFRSALLKKIFGSWVTEAAKTVGFSRRALERHRRSWLHAWKAQASVGRQLRDRQQSLVAKRLGRSRSLALHSWTTRSQQRVQQRQRACDFKGAIRRRTGRRFLAAWLLLRHEAAATRRRQQRRLSCTLQAWVAQWQDGRQEAALLRLSALCLRRRSLQAGLQALRLQVRRQARRRAHQKVRGRASAARRQLLEASWAALVNHAEQQRLRKLYQSWADVHRLRAMLATAWQVWLSWFRKRGKVVAMRSAPQLLAAWRWLRVHAACSAPGRSVRRLQLPTDTTAAAPWQPVAAELLFGSAPFDVHPHHIQAVQPSLLALFASALLKKIMLSWLAQVHDIQDRLEQARQGALRRCVREWQARSRCSRRRRFHESAVAVAQERGTQLFEEWKQSCGAQILMAWAEAARSLALQETRRLLQADDIRRRCRRKAAGRAFAHWSTAVRLRCEAAKAARIRKVFSSWHLAVQEQALLQKYLQECASVTLQGSSDRMPHPTTTRPTDLEQVYREMAELRWDVMGVEAKEDFSD